MRRVVGLRQRAPRASLVAVLLGLIGALALAGCGGSHSDTFLRVKGNHLVYGADAKVVQLRGVNRSGTEYECVNNFGYFQNPNPLKPDSKAMIAAMKSWDIDVVRVPLNEGCWLGVNAPARYSGASYRAAITAYVHRLTAAHLFVILDLQWASPGSTESNVLLPMADAQHAPSFWSSVATTFKSNHEVLFDLFNEPFGISWNCWLNGCQIPAGKGSNGSWPAYTAVGMQKLVNVVRATGATQPLVVGGVDYALDLSGWLSHEPHDPDHNLVASAHTYGGRSPCDHSCLQAVLQTSQKAPVIFGELGETDCSTAYIDAAMQFADAHQIGYLGWAWDATDDGGGWSCAESPALITSYKGTPTPYGAGFENQFRDLGIAVRP
jgi:Cellulase (glycosyl hydrolase family 5)